MQCKAVTVKACVISRPAQTELPQVWQNQKSVLRCRARERYGRVSKIGGRSGAECSGRVEGNRNRSGLSYASGEAKAANCSGYHNHAVERRSVLDKLHTSE